MSPAYLLLFVAAYFILLLAVSWFTSRGSNNDSFFIGNKKSNWMLVAFGMIGTSLSGVTFVSVPGGVGAGNFYYFQVVLGYLLGYLVIAFILLPLYYRMNVTSIYAYLDNRFGNQAHQAGAYSFIISRIVGATARLYLVINILQVFILDNLGIPFVLTALVILLMILLYTIEGGVKTIIYTDTLQTSGMLIGLVVSVVYVLHAMHTDFSSALSLLNQKGLTKVFNTDPKAGSFYLKHILGGMFIAITMTGLDQEMMQKNISVKNLKDSQKNMMTFTAVLMLVNLLFLFLGGLLYLFAEQQHISASPDDLFPTIALKGELAASIGIIFIIALISALFPSVDGAITSLTSSYCIDILGMQKSSLNEQSKKRKRIGVHISFVVIFFIMILIFKWINDKLIIDFILKFAGITYGPLLGLFAFGMLTVRSLKQKLIIPVCILSPLITLLTDVICSPEWYEKKLKISIPLHDLSDALFHGYKMGNELIIFNGCITFIGLYLISKTDKSSFPNAIGESGR